ncbi:terminase large subunit [Carnobacterium antarcticum]|uniref:Terminase large subunit n=1 Tax=Carnobacterium antarcticum TaxID=2126436 RepID=A0ABW4NR48_9LACT|nr:terminase TerL endonuclease subunit [Carnobacterium sp. CP1]ALV21052.1 Phage terminase, large subunit [Carnobacterium sp. CP1]
MDYTTEYARKVVKGDILACKSVIKSCERHMKDLQRISDDDFLYFYDEESANKVIAFMEILPDPKTGQTFPLAMFQKFVVGSIYGWRLKNNPDARRFKKVVVSVARKNGKSLLISGIVLYEFLFGKNPAQSRQLFTAANDKEQAKIVFNMVAKQLESLRSKYPEVSKSTKRVREELKNIDDYSFVRPLSRETGGLDGYEMYVAVIDEYAAAKTTEVMELIESSQAQLQSPLTFIISTAGFNLNAPFYKIEWPYAKKVIDGEIQNETYFSYIAEQDSIEELEDEVNWIKSNPILEVEGLYDQLTGYLRERKKESQLKGTYNSVLVKNFNMWRQASEESYLSTEHWEAVKNEVPEDITGRRAWLGVDVGKSSDLFSISWATMADDHWHVDSHSFIATKYGLETKIKRDGIDYLVLEQRGECDITELESGVIDYDFVFEWLENFIYSNDLDVQGICYDPYQFGHILTLIEKNHPEWPLIEIRQGTMTLSMPTKQFRDDVINKKIRHDGNELLTSAINNAITLEDNNGIRINKSKNSNKIDPIDALLDAFAICYLESFDGSGYWTDEKVMSDDFGF